MQDATWETYELPPLPDAPPTDMFSSLEQQLANVREWNTMRRWGFTAGDFDAIDLTPRKHISPLVVDVIAVLFARQGRPGPRPAHRR